MFDNSYTQTLQDQIGQLSKLLGGQAGGVVPPDAPVKAANPIDYVTGVDGARAFYQRMLAGAKHIVWDNEKPIFYILEKDANGNPARIKICPFTVQMEKTPEEKYVSREDFNALVEKLDALLAPKKEVNDNG